MANPEHLEILKRGAEVWNEWRSNNSKITPNLRNADLGDMNLSYTNLFNADLNGANLSNADLIRANLSFAKLREAVLSKAILLNAHLSEADLFNVEISKASLTNTHLIGANLSNANLNDASLRYADLSTAILSNANLYNTDLSYANLFNTNLELADLNFANLRYARLDHTKLKKTKFHNAAIGHTIFSNIDLRGCMGLETERYDAPSEVGINTIYLSEGMITEMFLRGCGVPDNFITHMRSLTSEAIQFYSCFISYSSKDQDFADRLYAGLQNKGVRCWFAHEDLKIGDKIRDRIDESIRLRDKLLLILSENSIASDWVEHEVESALEEEGQTGRTILFPIRLDDVVMESNKAWAALIRRTRHIGDFTRWKDHDSYQKAFDRLLSDLKAEEKA